MTLAAGFPSRCRSKAVFQNQHETQTGMCAMNQVGVVHSGDSHEQNPGTLMWVSNDENAEFSEAYQYCLAHASQIAIRSSIADGLKRPAAHVRAIVVTQSERNVPSRGLVRDLREFYPEARVLTLLGACCEGMYAKVIDPVFTRNERLYCHQWRQALPAWLQICDAVVPVRTGACRSVAVVSATPATGSALMDLAESAGAVAIWCRDGCRWKMRSIDSVWWDDSTALAVSAEQWRERLRQFSGAGREPVHAWIANAPRGSQVLEARAGGVALTLSKPFQIAPLLALLDSSHSQEGDASAALRVA